MNTQEKNPAQRDKEKVESKPCPKCKSNVKMLGWHGGVISAKCSSGHSFTISDHANWKCTNLGTYGL